MRCPGGIFTFVQFGGYGTELPRDSWAIRAVLEDLGHLIILSARSPHNPGGCLALAPSAADADTATDSQPNGMC